MYYKRTIFDHVSTKPWRQNTYFSHRAQCYAAGPVAWNTQAAVSNGLMQSYRQSSHMLLNKRDWVYL